MAHAPATDFTKYLYESKFKVEPGEKGNIQFMCGGSRPFLLPDRHYEHAVERYHVSVQNTQPNFIVETLQGHVLKAFQDLDDRVIMRATQDPVTQAIKPWPADHAAAVLRAKQVAVLYHTEVLQKYYPDHEDLELIVQGADIQFIEKLDEHKQRIRQVLLEPEVDPDLTSVEQLPPVAAALPPPSSSSSSSSPPTDPSLPCCHAAQRASMELPLPDDFDVYSQVELLVNPPACPITFFSHSSSYYCCEECGRLPAGGTPTAALRDLQLGDGMDDEEEKSPDDDNVLPEGTFWALFKVGWHYTSPGIPITSAMLLQLRESFIAVWREHPTLGGRRSVLLQDYGTVVDRSVIINCTLRWPGSLKSKGCECLGKGPKRGGGAKGKRGPLEDCAKCGGDGFINGGRPYWPLFRLDNRGRVSDIRPQSVDGKLLRACMLRLVPEPKARPMEVPNDAPRPVPATADELEQRQRRGNKPVPVVFAHDAVGMKTWPKDEIPLDSGQGLAIRQLIRERSWPQFRGLELVKASIDSPNQRFICVKVEGTNSNYCMNKGSAHPQCTIYFLLRRATKNLHQKCFCPCQAGPDKPRKKTDRCKDYESEPIPIPIELFPRIFPALKEQYDIWTANPTLVSPTDFPASGAPWAAAVATTEEEEEKDDSGTTTAALVGASGRGSSTAKVVKSKQLNAAAVVVIRPTQKELSAKLIEDATIALFSKNAGSFAAAAGGGGESALAGPDSSALGNYSGRKSAMHSSSSTAAGTKKRKRNQWAAAPPPAKKQSRKAAAAAATHDEEKRPVVVVVEQQEQKTSSAGRFVFQWVAKQQGKLPPVGFGDAAFRSAAAASAAAARTPSSSSGRTPLSTGRHKNSKKARDRHAQPRQPRQKARA